MRAGTTAIVERGMRRDILEIGLCQQRPERLTVRRVVEVADDRDVAPALALETLVDAAHRLGLQPALGIGRLLRAVALALEMIDQHPHRLARGRPDGEFRTIPAED